MKLSEFREIVTDDYCQRGQMVDWVEIEIEDMLELMEDVQQKTYALYSRPDCCLITFKVMGIDVYPLGAIPNGATEE